MRKCHLHVLLHQSPVLDKSNALLEDENPGWFEPIYLQQDRPESAGLLQQGMTVITPVFLHVLV